MGGDSKAMPQWFVLQVTALACFGGLLIVLGHSAIVEQNGDYCCGSNGKAREIKARVSLRGLPVQTEASYQPKLHTVTVATYDMESLHTMLKSNPDVILLGMGEQWGGFRTKFILMLDFLRTVHPDDVVLFVDAFDTLFLECDRGLLETYLALGHDIIFNAETNCWPEQWKAPFFPEHPGPWRAPHIQHRPRFLNSGVYMGRVRALLHYYTKDFVANGQWENPGLDDQRWWVDLFLAQQMHPEKARNEPSIAIDYAGDLFQEVAAAPYLPFYSWERDPVTNHVRNTDGVYSQPACLIHAPGWMTPLWGVLQPRLEAKETILLSPELMRPYGDAWYTHTAEPKVPGRVNATTLLQLPVSVYGKNR